MLNQLSSYGFRKINRSYHRQGESRREEKPSIFTHPCFQQGYRDLASSIKRNSKTTKVKKIRKVCSDSDESLTDDTPSLGHPVMVQYNPPTSTDSAAQIAAAIKVDQITLADILKLTENQERIQQSIATLQSKFQSNLDQMKSLSGKFTTCLLSLGPPLAESSHDGSFAGSPTIPLLLPLPINTASWAENCRPSQRNRVADLLNPYKL